ncbi:MAG: hypothetical protein R2854_12140 [Caldilineaceae bacterium]
MDDPELTAYDRRVLAWILAVAEGVEGAPARDMAITSWYPRIGHGQRHAQGRLRPVGGGRGDWAGDPVRAPGRPHRLRR